jgi:hypothetical protein
MATQFRAKGTREYSSALKGSGIDTTWVGRRRKKLE